MSLGSGAAPALARPQGSGPHRLPLLSRSYRRRLLPDRQYRNGVARLGRPTGNGSGCGSSERQSAGAAGCPEGSFSRSAQRLRTSRGRHGAGEWIAARLLLAIGRVESGRWDSMRNRVTAWPWTINAAGKGLWFATKDDAAANRQRVPERAAPARSMSVAFRSACCGTRRHSPAWSRRSTRMPTRRTRPASCWLCSARPAPGTLRWRPIIPLTRRSGLRTGNRFSRPGLRRHRLPPCRLSTTQASRYWRSQPGRSRCRW